jgi:hypothetical protein
MISHRQPTRAVVYPSSGISFPVGEEDFIQQFDDKDDDAGNDTTPEITDGAQWPVGCSERPFRKAAASEEVNRTLCPTLSL